MRGKLRASVNQIIAQTLLGPKMAEFAARYPNLSLELLPPAEAGGLINSGIAAFYYLRLLTALYSKPADGSPVLAVPRMSLTLGFAILLAACPLGIGLLWAPLDDDTLGWHDRISRIYQRSY